METSEKKVKDLHKIPAATFSESLANKGYIHADLSTDNEKPT